MGGERDGRRMTIDLKKKNNAANSLFQVELVGVSFFFVSFFFTRELLQSSSDFNVIVKRVFFLFTLPSLSSPFFIQTARRPAKCKWCRHVGESSQTVKSWAQGGARSRLTYHGRGRPSSDDEMKDCLCMAQPRQRRPRTRSFQVFAVALELIFYLVMICDPARPLVHCCLNR